VLQFGPIKGGHFEEEDLVPLSALQHLVFCERQCALIYVEQVWKDNPLTLEGSHLHERTHESGPRREVRGDLVVCRGLPVRSLRLGVSGNADVVEFHRCAGGLPHNGEADERTVAVALKGLRGLWRPFPVEYKRGKPKRDHCDEVQLCAQAMSLEEMLSVAVPAGALFYGATQHRHDVPFTAALREETTDASRRLHALIAAGSAPRVAQEPKCRRCSLVELCRPDATAPRKSASRYLAAALHAVLEEEEATQT
jgi:CRISPR-associated exonuclease Cas4